MFVCLLFSKFKKVFEKIEFKKRKLQSLTFKMILQRLLYDYVLQSYSSSKIMFGFGNIRGPVQIEVHSSLVVQC